MAKTAGFELLYSPKLISRKIWMTEKWWNFHTVICLLLRFLHEIHLNLAKWTVFEALDFIFKDILALQNYYWKKIKFRASEKPLFSLFSIHKSWFHVKSKWQNSLIFVYSIPGNVFSKTNLSPNSKGKAAGKGLVFTWNPKKHKDI